jgi:pyruvate,water dikinase
MQPIVKGMGASPGVATGTARLCASGDDCSSFTSGEILVTRITDPTMVQAMIKVAAIVTDIGGMTSHPAVLSREMGIPCVVNAKEATRKIANGMRIKVDGSTGEVHVLD